MFKKNSDISSDSFDTLIGTKSVFTGNIESEGSIRIDGKLKGDIKANGDVYIGSNAEVTGNITTSNASIAGTLKGNINSTGILKILSSAKLYGDISVKSFVVDEGAVFEGKCNMSEPSNNAKKQPSK